ncbi:MAG: heat shock protein transcriptional repressor HspR [Thermoleophilaceae bacterium]|jgi:MerR family transcriptional regulator/heat shock protein HspR
MAASGSGRGRSAGRVGEERVRGVYMISVAAQLAGMHPQTLRIYETRGLVTPGRSGGNTRLYSEDDVERLRRIQALTGELGLNLAGVERVLELERELEAARRRLEVLERRAERAKRMLEAELEEVRRSARAELVRYEPPAGRELVPVRDLRAARVRLRVLPSDGVA